jgi:hypothetical protein
MPPLALPVPLPQGVVDPDQQAGAGPLVEVVADGARFGEVVRDVAPGAAGAQEVEDGVGDLPQVDLAGSAHVLGRLDEGAQQLPLLVGQVAGIAPPSGLRRHDRFVSPRV